jgi:hypothetical protein
MTDMNTHIHVFLICNDHPSQIEIIIETQNVRDVR